MSNLISVAGSRLTIFAGGAQSGVARLMTGQVSVNFGTRTHRTSKQAGTGLMSFGSTGMRGGTMTVTLLATSADEAWLAGYVEREKNGEFINWDADYVYETGERAEMRKGQITEAPEAISNSEDGGENVAYVFMFETITRDVTGVTTGDNVIELPG